MEIVKNSTSYSVYLPDDMARLVLDDGTLYERLDQLPVFDINYDGHFGAQVAFSVFTEDDCPPLHRSVLTACLNRWREIQKLI